MLPCARAVRWDGLPPGRAAYRRSGGTDMALAATLVATGRRGKRRAQSPFEPLVLSNTSAPKAGTWTAMGTADMRCVTCVVEGTQHPKLVHGLQDIVLWWRVHEVEVQQVLHVEALEEQHDVGQVGPLDLRNGRRQQLVPAGQSLRELSHRCFACLTAGQRLRGGDGRDADSVEKQCVSPVTHMCQLTGRQTR